MLNKRIAELRKKNKKTQQDIANLLGITRPAYTAYERGTRSPDYESLQKLAEFYDVTTDYLLGRTDDPNPPDKEKSSERDKIIHKLATEFPEADLMFHDLASMTAEQLKEVYEFIKFKQSQKKK